MLMNYRIHPKRCSAFMLQLFDAGYDRAVGIACIFLATCVVSACASRPAGADFPKSTSTSLEHPEVTALGRQFQPEARRHTDLSGYRIINVGIEGFRARMELIEAAQKAIDLQYYIFRGDETGRLLTEKLRQAAERGVRIRILVDDADTEKGDQQILQLAAYSAVEIRIFNPYAYRGHSRLLRDLTFFLRSSQLDYRMHNKLMVADGSAALIGGRNIGNEYFQVDPQSQFADEDVFVAGPMVRQLAHSFDQFWNSDLAIPAAAFGSHKRENVGAQSLARHESGNVATRLPRPVPIDYTALLATDGPFSGITKGRVSLVWAPAQLVYDSPDKKQVETGAKQGRLIDRPVLSSASEVKSELLMITPFFVPSPDELKLLKSLRDRRASVRILTNSLESNPQIAAQSGYQRYRVALLEGGAKLYEIRSMLGNVLGSGETARMSRYGHYGLHGKMYVFDRQKVFLGSMNFDERSEHINTEIGLIISSPELARQTADRLEEMVRPENCFRVELSSPSAPQKSQHLEWKTNEGGREVVYTHEPARSNWQRFKARLLSLLPIRREL
jgi:cardiolipin synthase C